jgi:hypothetical protein
MHTVPNSIRQWFLIHFFTVYLVAIPLFIDPIWLLGLFGFSTIDPVSTRLVAAALFGIGGASYWVRDKNADSYKALLQVKILWSGMAIIGLSLSLFEGAPAATWGLLGVFLAFHALWHWCQRKLG